MNTNGPERRKILQGGLKADVFLSRTPEEQNLLLYNDLHTMAANIDDFMQINDKRLNALEKAKKYAIRGLCGAGGLLSGLGMLEHQTILKWLAKLI